MWRLYMGDWWATMAWPPHFSTAFDSIAEVMSGGKKKKWERIGQNEKQWYKSMKWGSWGWWKKLGGSQCQYCRLCLPLVISERAEGSFYPETTQTYERKFSAFCFNWSGRWDRLKESATTEGAGAEAWSDLFSQSTRVSVTEVAHKLMEAEPERGTPLLSVLCCGPLT